MRSYCRAREDSTARLRAGAARWWRTRHQSHLQRPLDRAGHANAPPAARSAGQPSLSGGQRTCGLPLCGLQRAPGRAGSGSGDAEAPACRRRRGLSASSRWASQAHNGRRCVLRCSPFCEQAGRGSVRGGAFSSCVACRGQQQLSSRWMARGLALRNTIVTKSTSTTCSFIVSTRQQQPAAAAPARLQQHQATAASAPARHTAAACQSHIRDQTQAAARLQHQHQEQPAGRAGAKQRQHLPAAVQGLRTPSLARRAARRNPAAMTEVGGGGALPRMPPPQPPALRPRSSICVATTARKPTLFACKFAARCSIGSPTRCIGASCAAAG